MRVGVENGITTSLAYAEGKQYAGFVKEHKRCKKSYARYKRRITLGFAPERSN